VHNARGVWVDRRAPTCRFGPDRRLTAACAVLALIALAAALLTDDRAGRVLLGGAAVVLIAYTVTDLVFWPRLVASADGLVIHTPLLRARIAWPDVDAVRADARDRLGLRSVTLEIDAGDTLAVFSRRALGADPGAVAGMINALDPRHSSG
jgi:hypothetical protein